MSTRYQIGSAASLFMLILLSMPLIGWCSFLARNAAFPQSVNFQAVPRPVLKDWLVVPGTGVGGLELGNSEEVISTLFPRPLVSRSPSLPECGMEYFIGVLTDAKHPGALNVFTKDGKVVEIEAVKGHYQTPEGIGSGTDPDQVKNHYHAMKSYMYLLPTNEALNESPLIIWVDAKLGLAFSFTHAHGRTLRFLVYSLIVFKPGDSFCEEGSIVPDPKVWRELAPYSLELPDSSAD